MSENQRLSRGLQALAEVFGDEHDDSAPPHADRFSMEMELKRLSAMPPDEASRYLAWRIVAAFGRDQVGGLLFWAIATARFYGWQGDPDIYNEMAVLLNLGNIIN